MISSEFAVAMDCSGSAGGAWAENRDPKGGSGAFDEASGLAGGYNFSYHLGMNILAHGIRIV